MYFICYKSIVNNNKIFLFPALLLFFLISLMQISRAAIVTLPEDSIYNTRHDVQSMRRNNTEQIKDYSDTNHFLKIDKGEKIRADTPEQDTNPWSNAFNFQKSWGTQVDPRTGTFSTYVKVGSLISNLDRGPNIDLEVSYNSNDFADPDNIGQGWNWNLTHFNLINNQLSTSQGQNFILEQTATSRWWPRYHKLQDIQIEGSKKTHFVITYSNGLRETLDHEGYEVRLEQQDGRGVDFIYIPGSHRLNTIRDDQGHKITLVWKDNYLVSTSLDSNKNPVDIYLNYSDHKLLSVTLPGKKNLVSMGVYFTYYNSLLQTVSYSTGLEKHITYNCNNEMKLELPQSNEYNKALCVVIRETMNPGAGQPMREVNYTYGKTSINEHNYLGYHSGLSILHNPIQDILFEAPVDYCYKTSEDNGVVKQIRTYNKYHLLIDAKIVSDHTSLLLSEIHNYFCDPNKEDGCAETSFKDLPVTYSLPLKVVTSEWGENSKYPAIDTVTKTYDFRGRITSTRDTYGRTKKITYCPVQGDTACPPEPDGWSLSSQIKSVTEYPSDQMMESPTLPAVIAYNYYRKGFSINGKSYILVLARKVIQSGKSRLITTNQYYNNPNDYFTYGLLQQQKVTGTVRQNNNLTSVTKHYYYVISADHSARTIYTTIDIDDKHQQQSASETISLLTNQLLECTDAEGKNTTRYFYDSLGRLIRLKSAIGTPFELSQYYHYTVSPQLNQVIFTAGSGLQEKIIFNGIGEKLIIFRQDISDEGRIKTDRWLPVQSFVYDVHGRVTGKNTYTVGQSGKINALTATLSYSDKNRAIDTYLPDGERLIKKYDDSDRCTVSYVQNKQRQHSVISVIRANMLDNPIEQIILPASVSSQIPVKTLCLKGKKLPGARTTIMVYDGFGRKTSAIFPDGKIVARRYDELGRVTEVTDPAKNTTHYVYNLTGQVIAKWLYPAREVHQYLLYSAEYNGAGMMIWQAGEDGKRTWYTYTHDGKIAKEITPADHVIEWQYNVLNQPVKELTDGQPLLQISYDPVTTLPIKKTDVTGVTIYAYSDDGKIQALRRYGQNGYPDYHLKWRYDHNRQMVSATDLSGREIKTNYDIFGRISSTYYQPENRKKQLLSFSVYDGFSRIKASINGSGVHRMFNYNDYGQQKQVTDILAGKLLLQWQYRYDTAGNISMLIQSEGENKRAVIHYYYDLLNNLNEMVCSGSSDLPLCPRETSLYGSGLNHAPVITQQRYRFNSLNRMTQIREKLITSTKQKTISKIINYDYSDPETPLRLQRISMQWNNKKPYTNSFIYDAEGNMVVDGENDHLTYNLFNQIIKTVKPTGEQVHYSYDGSGRETMEIMSKYDTRYLFHISQILIGEKVSDSNGHSHTVGYLGNAKSIDGIISEYYEKNYKGDVTGVMTKTANGSYALNQLNIYSPYGMVWHSMSKADLPLYQRTLCGFNGEETDPATGWQFLGAGHRTYNPKQHYFVSEDSAGDGYAFGNNNPIMNTDPSGNIPKWLGKVSLAFGYAGTFGFAAAHKKWATITGTVFMLGLTTVASGIAACFGASLASIATATGVMSVSGGLSVATAVVPTNRGLNIANNIVGGISVAIALATAGIGSALSSFINKTTAIASVEETLSTAANDLDISTSISSSYTSSTPAYLESSLESWHDAIENDSAGADIHYVRDDEEIQNIWELYRDKTGNMTNNDIPALLGVVKETTQQIRAYKINLLIQLEKNANGTIYGIAIYNNFFESELKKLFPLAGMYTTGMNLEGIIPEHTAAFIIGYMNNQNRRLAGYIVRYHDSSNSAQSVWGMYRVISGSIEFSVGDYRYLGLEQFLNDQGALPVKYMVIA